MYEIHFSCFFISAKILWIFFLLFPPQQVFNYDEFSSGLDFKTSSLGRAPPKMLAVWLVPAKAAGGAPTVRGNNCNRGRAAASSVNRNKDIKIHSLSKTNLT